MTANPYEGRLVRLVPADLENDTLRYTKWCRDSQFTRLMDDDPAMLRLAKNHRDWFEHHLPEMIYFTIRTLAEDTPVGFIDLSRFNWVNRDACVGIGIGDRACWGKGYGTDAMQVLVRYAFEQLDLFRITLDVFAYNPRAIRSYEKAGFREEGRLPDWVQREGRRWDLVTMGVLKSEWQSGFHY